MFAKIEARILIYPGTDFHFPSTSVPPGMFLGSGDTTLIAVTMLILNRFSTFFSLSDSLVSLQLNVC